MPNYKSQVEHLSAQILLSIGRIQIKFWLHCHFCFFKFWFFRTNFENLKSAFNEELPFLSRSIHYVPEEFQTLIITKWQCRKYSVWQCFNRLTSFCVLSESKFLVTCFRFLTLVTCFSWNHEIKEKPKGNVVRTWFGSDLLRCRRGKNI